MIRLLGVLVVLFVLFAAVGYYRGWFHAQSSDNSVSVSVDKSQLNQDAANAKQDVQNLANK